VGVSPGAIPETVPDRGFASDVLWTFLFPASPRNLIAFATIWGILVIAPLFLCIRYIGWFVWLVVMGWYCAFRFEVLASAAGGERDLPDVEFSSEHVADYAGAFVQWVGSWIVVLLPALIHVVVAIQQGRLMAWTVLLMLFGGLPTILQESTTNAVFGALVYLGIFLWPIVILCIALGGFPTLYRLDLILLTIIKTFPVYVLTLALMAAAVLAQMGLLEVAGIGVTGQNRPSVGGVAGGAILLHILTSGLQVYLDIVLVRLIGLYYHHFKSRFAWTWD
jgi:hypothetical protein